MTKQHTPRRPGRPRTGRKPRIDATLSREALEFIDWLIGEQGNVSGFLDEQVKAHPRYEEWKQRKQKGQNYERSI